MPIDYKKYPPNWKSEIVPKIIQRSNNKCEICGVKNGAELTSIKMWIKDGSRYKYKTLWLSNKQDVIRLSNYFWESKKVKVVLTIAHLDHDETNWDVTDDRLKAMCQMCHLNYDAKEKYRRACQKGSE
jgi:hypothetical protein